jgi:hypothetical protein
MKAFGREDTMRFRLSAVACTILSLLLFATSASAQDKGKGKKRDEGDKVEMKDVPAAVTDAAKKELPNATFTAANKRTQKKAGALYTLEGKDGKYQVSVTLSSSGELQRLTKALERKKKGS